MHRTYIFFTYFILAVFKIISESIWNTDIDARPDYPLIKKCLMDLLNGPTTTMKQT